MTAVFNKVRAAHVERKMPPLGRFVDVDGIRLHYIESGEGPPLVLLHGNGAMIQDMMVSGIYFELAKSYRVIAFDRPGFGYSERPRTIMWTPQAQAKLLRQAFSILEIDQAVVAGHSWGTLVAIALALLDPPSVRALVLLSGYYFPTLRLDAFFSLPSTIPVIGDVLCHTVSPMIARATTPAMIKKLFEPSAISKRFVSFPTEMALRSSQLHATAADAALMVPAAAALSQHYHDLSLPVVIVAGDGDKVVGFVEQSDRLHRCLPNSRLIRVSNGGHMIHHSAPDEVISAIKLAFDLSLK